MRCSVGLCIVLIALYFSDSYLQTSCACTFERHVHVPGSDSAVHSKYDNIVDLPHLLSISLELITPCMCLCLAAFWSQHVSIFCFYRGSCVSQNSVIVLVS